MNIVTMYLMYWIIGYVFGFIGEWNKKIMQVFVFIIFGLCIISFIFGFSVDYDLVEYVGVSNWHWIGFIIISMFGNFIGGKNNDVMVK